MSTILTSSSPSQQPDSMETLANAYERHHQQLVGYIGGYLTAPNRVQAEDLAQNVWAALRAVGDPAELTDNGPLPHSVQRTALAVLRCALSPQTRSEIEERIGHRDDAEVLAAARPVTPPRSHSATALEFSNASGAPASWDVVDIEVQQNLAAVETDPAPVTWTRPLPQPASLFRAA